MQQNRFLVTYFASMTIPLEKRNGLKIDSHFEWIEDRLSDSQHVKSSVSWIACDTWKNDTEMTSMMREGVIESSKSASLFWMTW